MAMIEMTDICARTVGDIMQRHVSTVFADLPISEVARILWDDQIGGAPVVDAMGKPIGFISASDLVRHRAYGLRYTAPRGTAGESSREELALDEELPGAAWAARGGEPRARDLMTPATIAIRPGATVPQLARFLVNAGIHRALVMDRGRLVGIVSASDIVTEVARLTHADAPHEAIGEDLLYEPDPVKQTTPLMHDDAEC